MSLPNEFWNSNLSGAVVGGAIGLVAALIASVIPIIWTTHHDRYKRNLEEYDRYLHLSGALLNEINHLRTCVNEALQVVNQYAQNNKVVLPTERLNTEFLKAARLQLATISSSSGIFPSVTRALQEVDHCNGMLDRYENEGSTTSSTFLQHLLLKQNQMPSQPHVSFSLLCPQHHPRPFLKIILRIQPSSPAHQTCCIVHVQTFTFLSTFDSSEKKVPFLCNLCTSRNSLNPPQAFLNCLC